MVSPEGELAHRTHRLDRYRQANCSPRKPSTNGHRDLFPIFQTAKRDQVTRAGGQVGFTCEDIAKNDAVALSRASSRCFEGAVASTA